MKENTLKSAIKRHGSSISAVAKMLGITQSTLSEQITNGTIGFKRVQDIANLLHCSVSDFLADDGSKVTIICPHCGKPITFKIEDSEESEK